MRKTIYYFLFIGILFSCTKKSDKLENIINIKKTTPVSIFDLSKSVDVIKLETNNDCLIESISDVVFYNNRFYILDIRQQGLFCFDATGKFIYKIFRKGQGPEEYIYIGSFNIDPFNKQLLILEPFGNLLTFDLNGNFISKTRLPKEIAAYNEVFPLNNDTLLFISINRYSIVTYDKKRKTIINKLFDDENKNNLLSPINKTYSYNDQVFFSPPISNDIINVKNDSVFTWNFGHENNTQGQVKKVKEEIKNAGNVYDDYVQKQLINYYIIFNYETERYKICMLRYGKEEYKCRYIFYDKKIKKPFIFEQTDEGIQFLIPFYNEKSVVLTDHVTGQIRNYKIYDDKILTDQQREIIKQHNTETDNPLLFKYNFKE